MATAAPALDRKPARRARGPVGYPFTPLPNRFWRDHARNLANRSVCRLFAVGLINEMANDVGCEDVAISAKELAKYAGQTERNMATALGELQNIGVIQTRRVGTNLWAYGFDRQALSKLPEAEPRKLSVMPKPADPVPEEKPQPLPCPKDGSPCPVAATQYGALVDLRTGSVDNKGESPTRTEAEFIPGKTYTTSKSAGRRVQVFDLMVARFGKRLATVPSDETVEQILRKLRGASLEHFDYLMSQKADRVRTWAFLVHLAEDCAKGKHLWAAAQAPEAGLVGCRNCGRYAVLVAGRCPNCNVAVPVPATAGASP